MKWNRHWTDGGRTHRLTVTASSVAHHGYRYLSLLLMMAPPDSEWFWFSVMSPGLRNLLHRTEKRWRYSVRKRLCWPGYTFVGLSPPFRWCQVAQVMQLSFAGAPAPFAVTLNSVVWRELHPLHKSSRRKPFSDKRGWWFLSSVCLERSGRWLEE